VNTITFNGQDLDPAPDDTKILAACRALPDALAAAMSLVVVRGGVCHDDLRDDWAGPLRAGVPLPEFVLPCWPGANIPSPDTAYLFNIQPIRPRDFVGSFHASWRAFVFMGVAFVVGGSAFTASTPRVSVCVLDDDRNLFRESIHDSAGAPAAAPSPMTSTWRALEAVKAVEATLPTLQDLIDQMSGTQDGTG